MVDEGSIYSRWPFESLFQFFKLSNPLGNDAVGRSIVLVQFFTDLSGIEVFPSEKLDDWSAFFRNKDK